MGPDRFTCTKCQLRIWRNFLGYELTPTDLQEMLHGEKVTSTEKTLTRHKDGQEITIRGRLMFTEEYRVRIAPKIKTKQPTDQPCPKCQTGKLQLITGIDDGKWYGCSAYPQCRFTKSYVPHTFKSALPESGSRGAKSGSKSGRESAGGGQSESSTLTPRRAMPQAQTSAGTAECNQPRDALVAENGAPMPTSGVASTAAASPSAAPDRYRHIPKFILDMLHLTQPPKVAPPGGRSIS
jgi:ssDNA-binding Zn-finger/Zn-ribbon topoisomerase 1